MNKREARSQGSCSFGFPVLRLESIVFVFVVEGVH